MPPPLHPPLCPHLEVFADGVVVEAPSFWGVDEVPSQNVQEGVFFLPSSGRSRSFFS